MKSKIYLKSSTFLKILCIRLIYLLTVFVSAQLYCKNSDKKTDSLLMLADRFIHKDYQKSLLYSTEASRIAEKDSDSEKKAWSYFYIAKSMALLKKIRQSDQYIDKALEEEATEETPLLKALLKLLKISIYSRLDMKNLMIEDGNEVLEILENDPSLEARLVKARTLYSLSLAVSDRKQSDHYAYQCQNILNQISEKQYDDVRTIFKFKSYFYNIRGEILLERKNLDSAQYYFFKAYHDSYKDGYVSKNTFLNSIGNLYSEKGDQKKALVYYLKALADINQHDKDAFARNGPDLLKKIYGIYKLSGDDKNYRLYYEKYQNAHEQFSQHLNSEVLTTTNILLDKKVSEHAEEKQDITLIFIIAMFSAVTVLISSLYYHSKIRRKKDLLLEQKEIVLLKTEQDASTLSMKVDDTLQEVVEAAKKNLPEFWSLFQKLYPDFSKKLLILNPDMKTSELILCAYAFLGFTSKDIAVYTFKAVQTVKNNKHNVRKRLSIPAKQDLNIWLREFYDI